ncbi:site-specific integrase [Rhodococcus kroppenstedtii]|nr:site-specific integrase [Rhodococcus kroppenstedtii]
MPRNQLPPQIKKLTGVDRRTGSKITRYQVTIDAGTRNVVRTRSDGSTYVDTRRSQSRRRFETEKEARAFLARTVDEVNRGIHVASNALTVDDACEAWLAARRVRPTTKSAYRHALQPLRQRHGALAVQKLSKTHLVELVNALVDGGTPSGPGRQRRPWSAQTINPMLNIISAVLTDLLKQGVVVRNVAALVDRLPRTTLPIRTFDVDQVQRLLAVADQDRNGHAWHLALSGLRRGEIGGLRWSDVDLDAGTLWIRNNRVSVNGQAVEGLTKTDRSTRLLPLTPVLATTLADAFTRQAAERRSHSQPGSATHVVCDELGRPYHPDTLSHFWSALCDRADVPKLRLHDARHTCATLMHLQHVPIAVISAWLGHADSAFTMRTYAHSTDDALRIAASTLQSMFGPAGP